MGIFILSDAIRSGKTSQLLDWSKSQANVYGILTPDVEGLRVLMDVASQQIYPFQVKQKGAGTIQIGRFTFLKNTFETGKKIIARALQEPFSWLIIDEIGPLELAGSGFEPQVSLAIEQVKKMDREQNLLLVIRRSLLQQCLQHYHISDYQPFDFPA